MTPDQILTQVLREWFAERTDDCLYDGTYLHAQAEFVKQNYGAITSLRREQIVYVLTGIREEEVMKNV